MKHFSFLEVEFLSQILYVFETFDTFVPKLSRLSSPCHFPPRPTCLPLFWLGSLPSLALCDIVVSRLGTFRAVMSAVAGDGGCCDGAEEALEPRLVIWDGG